MLPAMQLAPVNALMEDFRTKHPDESASDSEIPRRSPTPHKFCKHKGRCWKNTVYGFAKNFLIGGSIKALVHLLSGFARHKSLRLSRTAMDDVFRFSMFVGTFCGGYKAVNCALRHILLEENKLNSFVAGAISGTAILWLEPTQRSSIAVYLWLRAMVILVAAARKESWFPEKLRSFKHGSPLLMVLATAQILYGYILEQDTLPGNYLKFLMMAGRKDKRVIQGLSDVGRNIPLNQPALQDYAKEIGLAPVNFARVKGQAYPLCHIMHPHQSCGTHYMTFVWKHLIEYSARFYVPLTAFTTILFKRKHMFSDPIVTLQKAVFSCLRSSVFLSVYCGNAWLAQCMVRQAGIYSGKTSWIAGGIAAGLASLIEEKYRRKELAIYVMGPALQCAYACLRKWNLISQLEYIDAFAFAMAMGVIMFNQQNDEKSLMHNYPTLGNVMGALMGIN